MSAIRMGLTTIQRQDMNLRVFRISMGVYHDDMTYFQHLIPMPLEATKR